MINTFRNNGLLGIVEVCELGADADDEDDTIEQLARPGLAAQQLPCPLLGLVQIARVLRPLPAEHRSNISSWTDRTLLAPVRQESTRKIRTRLTPERKVKKDERRKHQYFLEQK